MKFVKFKTPRLCRNATLVSPGDGNRSFAAMVSRGALVAYQYIGSGGNRFEKYGIVIGEVAVDALGHTYRGQKPLAILAFEQWKWECTVDTVGRDLVHLVFGEGLVTMLSVLLTGGLPSDPEEVAEIARLGLLDPTVIRKYTVNKPTTTQISSLWREIMMSGRG